MCVGNRTAFSAFSVCGPVGKYFGSSNPIYTHPEQSAHPPLRPPEPQELKKTYHTQNPPNSITRLRPNPQPILRPTDIHLDLLHFPRSARPDIFLSDSRRRRGDGVVGPQDLEGPAVPRGARVRKHDVVAGVVAFGAAGGGDAGEAEFEDHG